MKIIELPTFEESKQSYDLLEARLKKFFRDHFYIPLLKELNLPKKTIQNAKDPNALKQALFEGRISFSGGRFSGKFNANISKELKAIGAKFDRTSGTFKLPLKNIPVEIKQLISASDLKFQQTLQKLDRKLAQVIPEELAENFKCADIFDRTLFKADTAFQKNVKNITVVPELSASAREKVSFEWQNNMKLSIRGWTEDQIKDMRKQVYEQITTGARREDLIPPIEKITRTIQKSHEQSLNKSKFLAHQESRLLIAKFKETRYTDAGISEYMWRCVHRPFDTRPDQHVLGNVRYSHGLLNGKIFKWSNPPLSTNPGQPARYNNPGQDFNCRCFARPILRKK